MVRVVKNPEVRRKEIVKAAQTLFLKKDYQNTTMTNVITRCKIAKGTLYHYFVSKEQLLEAVIEKLTKEHLQLLFKMMQNSNGNAVDQIESLMQAERLSLVKTKLLDRLHRPGNIELHARLLAATIRKVAPLYAALISKGCNEKIFYVDAPLETAEYILSASHFLTDCGCSPWPPEMVERRREAIPTILEAILKAPKGSFNFMTKKVGSDSIVA